MQGWCSGDLEMLRSQPGSIPEEAPSKQPWTDFHLYPPSAQRSPWASGKLPQPPGLPLSPKQEELHRAAAARQGLDWMRVPWQPGWLDRGRAPEGGGRGSCRQPQKQETFLITLGPHF